MCSALTWFHPQHILTLAYVTAIMHVGFTAQSKSAQRHLSTTQLRVLDTSDDIHRPLLADSIPRHCTGPHSIGIGSRIRKQSMNRHNGDARPDAPYGAGTGEHKRSSSVGIGREKQSHASPAGAADITPTQSRSTSPFRRSTPETKYASHRASATETSTPEVNGILASGASVDPSEGESLTLFP